MSRNPGNLRIGIDFDNTIVDYNKILMRITHKYGWIKEDIVRTKREVRNAILSLPAGEKKWMELQGLLYAELIHQASVIKGVKGFIAACRQKNIPVFIISQKTEYAKYGAPGKNLRKAAFTWLQRQGFLNSRLGLSKTNVFFENTLLKKLRRIKKTNCSHFIDDLEKVFNHPQFPHSVRRILFAKEKVSSPCRIYQVFSNWKDIREAIFNHAH